MKDIRGGWGGDTVDEFSTLNKELQSINLEVASQKETIVQARSDLQSALALLSQIQQLSSVVSHMKENLPCHLPTAFANQPQTSANTKSDKEKTTRGKTNVQEKVGNKYFHDEFGFTFESREMRISNHTYRGLIF